IDAASFQRPARRTHVFVSCQLIEPVSPLASQERVFFDVTTAVSPNDRTLTSEGVTEVFRPARGGRTLSRTFSRGLMLPSSPREPIPSSSSAAAAGRSPATMTRSTSASRCRNSSDADSPAGAGLRRGVEERPGTEQLPQVLSFAWAPAATGNAHPISRTANRFPIVLPPATPAAPSHHHPT